MSSPAARRPDLPLPRTVEGTAPGALERARLTVVPRTRRATRVPFVSLVTLLLLGGVVGLLLFNTSMQQASFATTALESQAANLAARQQTLQAELEELRSPQAVAERARDLGMVVPSTPAFLDLRTGEVTGGRPAGSAEDRLRLLPRPPGKPRALDPQPRIIDVPAQRSGQRSGQRSAGRGDGSGRSGAGSAGSDAARPRLDGAAGTGGTRAQEDRR